MKCFSEHSCSRESDNKHFDFRSCQLIRNIGCIGEPVSRVMNIWIGIIFLVVLTFASAGQTMEPLVKIDISERKSNDYYRHTRWYFNRLVNQFHRIAFTGELDGFHPRGRIVKWMRPLILYLDGEALYQSEIKKVTRLLSRLTGVKIQFSSVRERANVKVFLLTALEMEAVYPTADCYAEIRFDETSYSIESAKVLITADNSVMRRHCIHEELTQIMGLTNDSTLHEISIFNDNSRLTRLEREDRIMLVALYQPSIHPGMTETQAGPIIQQIMQRIMIDCPIRITNLTC